MLMRRQTKMLDVWDKILGSAQSQRKKMTIGSGGEFLLETQAIVLFLPQRSISSSIV